jgi:hypothetical protein
MASYEPAFGLLGNAAFAPAKAQKNFHQKIFRLEFHG